MSATLDGRHEPLRLINGLRVIELPAAAASFAVVVMIAAGARHEAEDAAGAAHLLEHLVFAGTGRRPGLGVIADELDSLGCRFNASTDREHTTFHIRGPAGSLDSAVELLADLIQHTSPSDEDVRRERRIALSELNTRVDNPRVYVRQLAQRALYGDGPLGRDIIGTAESIARLDCRAVIGFRDRHYSATRTVVAFSGDITPSSAVDAVERHFAALPALCDAGRGEPCKTVPHAIIVEREVAQAHVVLALPGPSYRVPEREMIAARMLNSIVAGSMSSRLFVALRERRRLCYTVRSLLEPLSDVGALSVYFSLASDDLGRAASVILSELYRLACDGVTAHELVKARAMTKGVHAVEREDILSRARFAALETHRRGRPTDTPRLFALIDDIHGDDLAEAASLYLRCERAYWAVIAPRGAPVADALPTDALEHVPSSGGIGC